MYMTTEDYGLAVHYWQHEPIKIFGAFHGVTAEKKGFPTHKHHAIFYVEVDKQTAVFLKLKDDVGVGVCPDESLRNLFNTKYVVYKEDVHIRKVK